MAYPSRLQEGELELVRSAAMLPIVMDVLEYDIKKINAAGLKVPTVHVSHLKRLQDLIMQDIKFVRQEMRVRGLKILEEGKAPNGYKVSFLCRGYKHDFVIGANILKSIVINRLCEMMGLPATSSED